MSKDSELPDAYGSIADLKADKVRLLAHIEALENRRIQDFVDGARWWEYDRENATMWQSDQQRATAAAKAHFRAQAFREAALAAKENRK